MLFRSMQMFEHRQMTCFVDFLSENKLAHPQGTGNQIKYDIFLQILMHNFYLFAEFNLLEKIYKRSHNFCTGQNLCIIFSQNAAHLNVQKCALCRERVHLFSRRKSTKYVIWPGAPKLSHLTL